MLVLCRCRSSVVLFFEAVIEQIILPLGLNTAFFNFMFASLPFLSVLVILREDCVYIWSFSVSL